MRIDKMKIAYFLDLAHGLGGTGTLLLQQAVLMSVQNEILVVIPADKQGMNEEFAKRCETLGLRYCAVQYNTVFNFCDIDFLGALESAKVIEELVKRENITFLHSVQLNIAVEYVARKLKLPHLMNIYQLREEEFACCPGDIYPHYHLCDSQLYRERWSRKLGIVSRCARPIAIRDAQKKKSTYPKEAFHILMLGSLYTRKNQLAAIKACQQCGSQYNIKLTIAGGLTDGYAQICMQYVKEHNLEKMITFKGFVSDIVPLLEENDCLLCTSVDESFPSSMVEASTYDLTIISTPVAGVPEIFRDKENAFISQDFTVESLTKSLLECIDFYQTGKIEEIHKNAERTWETHFARTVVKGQLEAYYQEILSNPYTAPGDFEKLFPEVEQTNKLLAKVYKTCEGMKQRALYHTKLRKELKKGKIYLWGAGKMGTFAYKILKVICPELEIAAFIDKNKAGTYYGLPILTPEELPIDRECFYGIAFYAGREDVIASLENRGLILNQQIWMLP